MDTRTSIELVREFHEKFGHPINDKPSLDTWSLSSLRYELLHEELIEFHRGIIHRNVIETLDALCDLQYVLDGAFLSLGLHKYKDAAMNEIHRSNMSKLGPEGKPIIREDGKILKGPFYSKPNLQTIVQG